MAGLRPESFFRGRASSMPLHVDRREREEQETVVITSREVNSLMEANTNLMRKIKDQAKALEAITASQKEIASIKEKIDEFETPPENKG